MDHHALLLHLLGEPQAELGVEAAQQLRAAVDERRLHAQAVEDGRETRPRCSRRPPPARASAALRWNASLEVMARSAPGIAGFCGQEPVATRMCLAVTVLPLISTSFFPRIRPFREGWQPCVDEDALIDAVQALDLAVLVGEQPGQSKPGSAMFQPKSAASFSSSRQCAA